MIKYLFQLLLKDFFFFINESFFDDLEGLLE